MNLERRRWSGAVVATMLIAAALGWLPAEVAAQTAELPRRIVPYSWRSGPQDGARRRGAPTAPARKVVRVAGVPWIQLTFGESRLGRGSYLEIKSLKDGATQRLDAETLKQWNRQSAYFNGDAVEVRLHVALPDRGVSVEIVELAVGKWGRIEPKSLCGADNRVASSEPRVGRIDPVGCTGWVISNGKLLTAGHCLAAGSRNSVLSFNVPPSLPDGTVRFPGPQHQYAINGGSFQYTNGGVGNDWGTFSVSNNSQTGLQPVQAQGGFTATRDLGPSNIRVTGFGVDSGATNQTNQTHVGPNRSSSGTTMRYATDTQGGNSGSPIIDAATGQALGIHTHGGCTASGGSNNGTSFFHSQLWAALGTTGGGCDGESHTGNLSGSGDSDAQPGGTYYFSGAGTHRGVLDGPSGTDFDLRLRKWNGSAWSTVASALSSSSHEEINYNGTSGYYYWRVESYSGSGSYTFCLTRP